MASGLALMGLGMFTEIMGQQKAGVSSARSLRLESRAAKQNAQFALDEAEAEADARMIQARKIMGEQVADFAASGVTGGSVFSVMADSLVNAEMDRLSILFGGDIRSKNFMNESDAKMSESRAVKKAANLESMGSFLNFLGTSQGGG